MKKTRIRVLVCVDWFEPGFKAGGPIRSAVNFVTHLKEELDIYVFTTDRDLGDTKPYIGLETDKWIEQDGYHVFYASLLNLKWKSISKLIQDVAPDYLYLNSMFSKYFSIYPLLMKKVSVINGKIVLAPRGMLKASALNHKPFKKSVFLKLIRVLGLLDDITFHATDQQEESDVRLKFGFKPSLFRQSNLPGGQYEYISPHRKEKGALKILFVGRIHPIKQLDYLLSILKELDRSIRLTIVAPIEDENYWNKCKTIIHSLPVNIETTHYDNIPHHQIRSIILENHILTLPTAGENFGHAIFEALAAGRPVLISDQTPWKDLEENKAGWVIPLSNEDRFFEVINQVADMEIDELSIWCNGAWKYCRKYLDSSDLNKEYLKLFS